jgi:hypothetical protein
MFRMFHNEMEKFECVIPEEMTEYSYYLVHLMEESLVRQFSTICFRNMDNCTCLASQLGVCLHNIPDGIKDQLLRTAERTFGGSVSVLRSDVTDDVSERLAVFADLLHPPQQTYVQCGYCMLVQKSLSQYYIPNHICHKASVTKTGA